MKGFKGFDKDLKCRGFQYEIGKVYQEERADCCTSGFHFCENPLDCLGYYEPSEGSRYCEVESLGDIDRQENSDDTKVCTNKIKIGEELTLEQLTKASINFVYEHVKKDNKKSAHKEEDNTIASNTGYSSVASNTGDSSVASNTGEKGIASSLGIESKAKAKKGNWIVLAEWICKDYHWEVKEVKTALVDGETLKEDTLYQLVNGEFVEVDNE